MTILGKHTVAETRDLVRATEFRVNKDLKQWEAVKKRRAPQLTMGQSRLDSDIAKFVTRWTDVRDTQTLAMLASVLANPGVAPFILPAEDQFVAISNARSRTEPRLVTIESGIDQEASTLGLPPTDLSAAPPQNSPDADFVALQKLDQAIAAAGNPLGKPGGSDSVATSPLGLLAIGGVALVGVVGVLYVRKNLL